MDCGLPVGGRVFFTKTNIAFSALSLILFRTTYTNCPTVKSAGTRYLQLEKQKALKPWYNPFDKALQAINLERHVISLMFKNSKDIPIKKQTQKTGVYLYVQN